MVGTGKHVIIVFCFFSFNTQVKLTHFAGIPILDQLQTDDFIVSQLSTAPEVELPHFASKIRTALKYMRDHPFPAVTVFQDNRPRYFRRDESGAWVHMRY